MSLKMLATSPQDPATQINTFKSYVALIADPSHGSDVLLLLASFAAYHRMFVFVLMVVTSPQYSQFLQEAMKTFLKILQEGEPQFIAENNSQQLRKLLLEIIHRIPTNDHLKPFVKPILSIMFKLLETDNEENVLVCLRIIIELHKQYRPQISTEVHHFLQFVKNIYKQLPNHLHPIFEPKAQMKVKDIIEVNVEVKLRETFTVTTIMTEKKNVENQAVSYNLIPKADLSLKVLAELPIIVVLMYQLYKQHVHNEVAEFIPLIMNTIVLQPSRQHRVNPAFNKEVFVDFIAASDQNPENVSSHSTQMVEGMLGLLSHCPQEVAHLRKELLIAARHILATELRNRFVRYIDKLFDENVLIGTGWTTHESLRPLAYSTLADLVHHVRQNLSLNDLSLAVNLFSKNVHDESLPSSIQTMSCKLLLNLVECIRTKSDAENGNGRELFMRMLEVFVLKFKTIAEIQMPMLLQKCRQPVETKNSGSTAPAAPSTPLPATPLPSTPLPSTPLPSTPVPVASCGPGTPSQGPSTPTVKQESDMKPVLTVKEEGRPPVVDKDRADDQKSIRLGAVAQWVEHQTWCSGTVGGASDLVQWHSGWSIRLGAVAQWVEHQTWCSGTVGGASDLVQWHSGWSIRLGAVAQWVEHQTWCSGTVGGASDLVQWHSGWSIRLGAVAQWVEHQTWCSGTVGEHQTWCSGTVGGASDLVQWHSGWSIRLGAVAQWVEHQTQLKRTLTKIGQLANQTPIYTVNDCRNLVKTLVSGVKTITWGTASCKAPSVDEAFIQNKQFLPKETLVYVRLVKYALQALDIYTINMSASGQPVIRPTAMQTVRTKEEKEVLEHFAGVYMVDRIHHNNALQIVANLFLANQATSATFATILVDYLLARLHEMGSNMERSGLYLKLFKLVFGSVSLLAAENEQMLKPHLHTIVNRSMELALTTKEPYNYFLLLRALFRSIGGGSHDLLYQEFLPLLPNLLQEAQNRGAKQRRKTEAQNRGAKQRRKTEAQNRGAKQRRKQRRTTEAHNRGAQQRRTTEPQTLAVRSGSGSSFGLSTKRTLVRILCCGLNCLQSGLHKQHMKDLFVELCLTVPVRLSSLLPYLPMLMDPLVSALNGSQTLVSQGLRTLELCVDNLQPDFLYDHIQPVRAELMQALWHCLRNPPDNVAHVAFRVLGKFGGSNRKMLKEAQKLDYNDRESSGPGVLVYFQDCKTAVSLPTEQAINVALNALKSSSTDAYYRKQAWIIVKCFLVSTTNLDDDKQSLTNLFTHFSFVEKEVATPGCHLYKCSESHTRQVQEQALAAMFVAAAIKELRAQVLNFMASMVRHYTMVAIAQQCGPFPLCSEKQSRLQVMDAHVLIDALAVIMGHEEKELCKPGQFALMLILEAATTILGSRDRACQLLLFEYLAERMCSLCYDRAWYAKLGGCQAIKFMFEKMSLRWVLDHQFLFLKALLFVMMDLTGEVSSGALDLAKANLEQMLKLCAEPLSGDNASEELVVAQTMSLHDVIHELVRQVTSPNTLVRDQAMHCLQVLAESMKQTVTEIMEPHKDVLQDMIPPKKHLLRYQPANAQIGLMEGNTFCTTLEPRLFTIDLNTVEHKVFFTELFSLCEAEDAILLKLPCYKSVSNLVPLRKSAMRAVLVVMGALSACHYIPQTREKIFKVLYKALNSNKTELQTAAHECMKKASLATQSPTRGGGEWGDF
ncbi:hypothetical protein NP493_930g01023 [Ridgeia piscesae]|uniref:Transformation/transcription domain-associated protein n=1 Tax=Ridgeia piscesae TaxID=27915 RepID=A0AAD9KKE1_RIDPI|nr:hypothetical protein NP493_930g01023 [Ridgeia piscesae]